MGEMELRRWPRRSRRRQDRVTTAATLATSVSHVSAVGSAPSKLAGALMPCFRRTASCAENRHAPMLREVGHGGWVGGPASGCSVRRSGVQRSRAQVKGGYLLSRPTLRFCANDFSRCSGSSPSPLAAAANERVFSLAAKETVDTVTSAAAGGGGAGVWCVRK